MSLRLRIAMIVLWAASLVAVGVWAQAQTPQDTRILSGNDIGFLVEGQKNGKPTGAVVVRINGQWLQVESSVSSMRLHDK